MRIALAIVSLFASGGLQRDCLSLARILRRRGNEVHLIAARCDTEAASLIEPQVLPSLHLTNHGRHQGFARALRAETQGRFDVVVGFNKLPGLDVLYCADRCVLATPVPMWKRLMRRHRTRRSLEEACFGKNSSTHILMLAAGAAAEYRSAWQTQGSRMTVLSPSVAKERMRPDLRATETRNGIRRGLGLSPRDEVWLFVAAYPRTKGLDRLLNALDGRTGVRVLVAGAAPSSRDCLRAHRLAKSLGVESCVSFLGHREDIPELMAAADVLVHPARYDMTGGVILEAISSGLPVITTDACGFSEHVRRARAGIVLDGPFEVDRLSEALDLVREPGKIVEWSRNASLYAARNDFSKGLHDAADVIERIAVQRS